MLCLKIAWLVANSVDSDMTSRFAASDQCLHYLHLIRQFLDTHAKLR